VPSRKSKPGGTRDRFGHTPLEAPRITKIHDEGNLQPSREQPARFMIAEVPGAAADHCYMPGTLPRGNARA
jgi:hypothetical protein